MGQPTILAPLEGDVVELDALLATKLHVPRTRRGLVARPRLAHRLTEGLQGELTVVCAPAGFGKTALLADWSQRSGRAVAWLSLDAGDNDPGRFWRHVAAALEGVRAGAGRQLGVVLRSAARSFEAAVTTLVNDLAAAPGEVVLVLDDYHLIESQAVHQSLSLLLEHPPAGLRLAVASRSDPPLPLARLRARGQLAEVRAAELRFTQQEAAALLREAVGRDLSEGTVAALAARTEGWAAGLQLAALSLLAQGQLTQAAAWAAARRLDAGDPPSYPREREHLLLARMLLGQGEPERARQLLERLQAAAAARQRTGSAIEVAVLLARALAACGDQAGALAALAEAVTLAWPEGYVRVFAGEGAPLATLLDQLIAGRRRGAALAPHVPGDYLGRLRGAFQPDDSRAATPGPTPRGLVVAGLAEPLTGRELEVLGLLAAGMANKQIAKQLVVALETAKKHVSHILGKLGAANRTQAVAHAHALGLLR